MAHPSERERARDVLPLGCGGCRKAAAQPGAARVDAQLPSGLGIDEPESAGIRQLLLARVADLDRDHVVATRELEQRPAPVARATEIRHEQDHRALSRERARAAKRRTQGGRADAVGRLGLCPQGRQEAEETVATLRRRNGSGVGFAERDDAEPVAAPRCDVADGERDPFGDIGLPALGGAELHRRRRVEDEPRDEHALGELDAHVCLPCARRHVPVDSADVVTRDVRTNLNELRSLAVQRRAVVAREQAFHPARERQVERAQQGPRKRARPGPRLGPRGLQ